MEALRSEFPALSAKVYGKNLVYLDNAATTMRPREVVDLQMRLQTEENANIHRAVHYLSELATKRFEDTRDAVRDFIGAAAREEIIFTSGDTASLNLVAYSFGETFVGEGDEIVVSVSEHHSNLVPWQQLCIRKGAVLRVLDVDENGLLDVSALASLLSPRTRLVAVTHISNVLGVVNPVAEIVSVAHAAGVPVLVDGAQAVAHLKVDVQKLDVDFYTFSGHKMFAATGTGVLYGKKAYLEKMPPFLTGGEMVGTVKLEATTFAALPQKFEAGTQNFNAIPTLVPAIEFVNRTVGDPETEQRMKDITDYLLEELPKIEGLRIFGVPRGNIEKIPLFSFVIEGVHHEDLALILDKMGVACRSGQMCAEPLMDRFGVTGMLRASFAPYNTMGEAQMFVESLKRAVMMLK